PRSPRAKGRRTAAAAQPLGRRLPDLPCDPGVHHCGDLRLPEPDTRAVQLVRGARPRASTRRPPQRRRIRAPFRAADRGLHAPADRPLPELQRLRRRVTSRGQTLSVLIADDHDLFAASLAELLTGEGLDVVGRAADGAEAVALASRLRPDVVVMDVSMPCCDGIEATREISGTLETTRVVM